MSSTLIYIMKSQWNPQIPKPSTSPIRVLAASHLLLGDFIVVVVLAAPCGMWDLSSPTRGRTGAPCRGSVKS